MLRPFGLTTLLCALLTVSVQADDGANSEAISLFNGQNLDGWAQAGGSAKYRVEDGTIVGEAVPNSPNTFLCTQRLYDDFELTYEYQCDDMLNSGVQIRSNVYAIETVVPVGDAKSRTIPAGRVHGYQVEIDPNKPERMWSGGIYDEGRRGWLFPGLRGGDGDKFSETGVATYKAGEWNSVKVRCEGTRIQTWLNGVMRADFEDDMTRHGVIALQVHGIGGRAEAVGKTVRWRNLKIRELN